MARPLLAVSCWLILHTPTLSLSLSHDFLASDDPDPLTVVAIGVHHRGGTRLAECLQDAWQPYLGYSKEVGPERRHLPARAHSRRYTCLDTQAYKLLTEGDYRLVHIVRDPVDVVISGYWHHLRVNDTQLVPDTGPNVLYNLTLQEGLEHEATSMLKSTLVEMLKVVTATRRDSKVRLFSLEDFVDDFDAFAARTIAHFMGINEREQWQIPMLVLGRRCDRTRAAPLRADRVSPDEYAQAWNSINQSASAVWQIVRSFRAKLGFVEVAPNKFRLVHNFSDAPGPRNASLHSS